MIYPRKDAAQSGEKRTLPKIDGRCSSGWWCQVNKTLDFLDCKRNRFLYNHCFCPFCFIRSHPNTIVEQLWRNRGRMTNCGTAYSSVARLFSTLEPVPYKLIKGGWKKVEKLEVVVHK